MDNCYQKQQDFKCKNNSDCDSSYTCCRQNGNNTVGLCTNINCGCNQKTGLAQKKMGSRTENFSNDIGPITSREGYSDSSSKTHKIVLFVSIALLVLFLLYLAYCQT